MELERERSEANSNRQFKPGLKLLTISLAQKKNINVHSSSGHEKKL